ncbi:unnamed protein product [Aspergillus oryzae RIB40]|uniref:DNA, SC010 n=1 Tax=Aspergillus oryzae (strain ATCC 42149 / RIB 40) TaxID=510516 RepID=Q2TXU0_ASPOR|nr:unnamed protein product [Aspergillus oryzae RIB40]BAE65933.1 unnamed protein product [Aspergillus oryzae RIB40]
MIELDHYGVASFDCLRWIHLSKSFTVDLVLLFFSLLSSVEPEWLKNNPFEKTSGRTPYSSSGDFRKGRRIPRCQCGHRLGKVESAEEPEEFASDVPGRMNHGGC